MKILFLNLPYSFPISRASRWPEKTKSGTLYYPYWLCYAAGVCMNQGLDVRVIDCIAEEDTVSSCIEKIVRFKPEYIVCEITTPTCMYDYKTIASIKAALPSIVMIVGGTHATALDREVLLKCSDIDVIARQEYDFTVIDIINHTSNLSEVLGITYRAENGTIVRNDDRPWIKDLDVLPMVSKVYEKFLNVRKYGYSLAESPMVQVFSARGCPFRCNFCSYPATMGGRAYRKRSVNGFVDELEYISTHMPYIKEVFIEDDTFTVDKKRVYEICKEIIRRRIRIKWSCNTRANLSGDLMRVMKKAGCRLLVVGFESGSQRVLDETQKGIRISDSICFMQSAKKYKIRVFGCFMIGLKGDNLTTIEQTYRFAKKLDPDMVFFQQAVPFPNTGLYNWVKEQGMLLTEDYSQWLDSDGTLRCLIDYPYASHTKIKKMRDSMMSRFYFSPGYIMKTIVKNLNPTELMRVIRAGSAYIIYRLNGKLVKKNTIDRHCKEHH